MRISITLVKYSMEITKDIFEDLVTWLVRILNTNTLGQGIRQFLQCDRIVPPLILPGIYAVRQGSPQTVKGGGNRVDMDDIPRLRSSLLRLVARAPPRLKLLSVRLE